MNLADVHRHAGRYTVETGLDPVAFLAGFRVGASAPGIEEARSAAALASMGDASLADRFAAATAGVLRGMPYTTDGPLAVATRRRGLPVTLF